MKSKVELLNIKIIQVLPFAKKEAAYMVKYSLYKPLYCFIE